MNIFQKVISLVALAIGLQLSLVVDVQAKPVERPNVVLIVVDTLRADHLPFYGYKRDTAPFLSSLAPKGWVFRNNFSTSSWTAPASASIVTSLYPFQHGVVMGRSATRRLQKADPKTKLNRIPESVETIAESLRAAGYHTFGVVDNGNLRPDAGFAQGFDRYEVFQNEGGEKLTATIHDWAKDMKKSAPYFLYMQFMDPHHPYQKREPWYAQFRDQTKEADTGNKAVSKLIASYDSEIRFVDSAIEDLFHTLHWDNNTVLALTSDHGEEFFEHKKLGHGKSMYSEVVRVPLFAYDSRNTSSGKEIESNTSNLDVVPTLLDLSGVTSTAHHEGKSLVPLARASEAQPESRYLFTHLWKRMPTGEEVEMHSTIVDGKRFISSSKPKVRAIFDIEQDPGEHKNLAEQIPGELDALEKQYLQFAANAKKFPKEWSNTNLLEERDEDGE